MSDIQTLYRTNTQCLCCIVMYRQSPSWQDWVAFMTQPYWVEVMVEVDIEAEVDLNLRLKWVWDDIEWKFSWNWVEVDLSWSWDKLTLTKGKNWAFIGVGFWFKICSRSTYVAEQHMFSMLLLISSNTKGIFLAVWGKNYSILRVGVRFNSDI